MRKSYLLALPLLLLIGCKEEPKTLFTELSASSTNIDFENTVTESIDLNVFTFDYIYNGAGVAAGDVNNDGLVDLYFSGNTVGNKLYLNKGGLEFDDATEGAGVQGKKAWATGVNFVDVNGDGWLDIYVCYSGIGTDEGRANLLYINDGTKEGAAIPTFTESAKAYGLDAPGTYTTQASFFDYDLDGDLDMFLLNHGLDYHSSYSNAMRNREARHPQFGNRLYKNDNNKFTDVSEQAGIYGGWLNFGLSISVSDFNNDFYPDLYVSNDFDEQDYFYVNNGDGTFTQAIEKCFQHISKFTMGSDIADFNNDLLPDVITLDMLPEDNYRRKLMKGADDFDRYTFLVDKKYHRQHMRNMLHLNRGFGSDSLPVFSEIGQISGISNTDWSWAALFADYDNDGWKDLYITNGYGRDLTNLDFQRYDFEKARMDAQTEGIDLRTPEGKKYMFNFLTKLQPVALDNFVFKNNGNLSFAKKTKEWGLEGKFITTGATYADLDNDGDLDLVTNNFNAKVNVYRNNADKVENSHFVGVRLKGAGKNASAIGAKVYVTTPSGQQVSENYVTRGFLSSVDPTLHFGIGRDSVVTQVKVAWPDGSVSVLKNPKADVFVTIAQGNAEKITGEKSGNNTSKIFEDVTSKVGVSFTHTENFYIDYKYDRLMLQQMSKQGPKLSAGDVNKDGRDDFFVGGAAGQSGTLYLGTADGFKANASQPWNTESKCEDIGSAFFDANGDGNLDLYVVSGGVEFQANADEYIDRLYLGNGKGNFTKAQLMSARTKEPGSCVAAADYDNDGDVDVFVGGGIVPGSYPLGVASALLQNQSGKGGAPMFQNVAVETGIKLDNHGMVTAAVWLDIDNDNWKDLIVAGHWMPLTIFRNKAGKFERHEIENSNGFWNALDLVDIDNDGDQDLVAGNLGLNSELRASVNEPLQAYIADYDNNGKVDPLIFQFMDGVQYPIATRDDLLSQLPSFKKKFVRYETYAKATIMEVLDSAQLAKAQILKITELRTRIFENGGNGQFTPIDLPFEAQLAPVQRVLPIDFNHDGLQDLLFAGNLFDYRVEYGPFDANTGVLIKNDGKQGLNSVSDVSGNAFIKGNVRDLISVKSSGKSHYIIISKNNESLQVLRLKQ